MTTLIIKVNERTSAGRNFISFIKSLPFVTVEKEKEEDLPDLTSNALDESLKDIEKGRVYTAKNSADLFNQILG